MANILAALEALKNRPNPIPPPTLEELRLGWMGIIDDEEPQSSTKKAPESAPTLNPDPFIARFIDRANIDFKAGLNQITDINEQAAEINIYLLLINSGLAWAASFASISNHQIVFRSGGFSETLSFEKEIKDSLPRIADQLTPKILKNIRKAKEQNTNFHFEVYRVDSAASKE